MTAIKLKKINIMAMKRKVFTLLAAVACGTTAVVQAQTTESTADYTQKLQHVTDGASRLRGSVWQNPVMEFYRYNIDLSTVELKGARRVDNSAAIAQRGVTDRYLQVDANTRLRTGKHTGVLGSAAFETGRQTGVRWNTQADLDLIYPYVMGTLEISSGQNFLNRQQYSFRGAYLQELGDFTVGVQLKYRAAIVSRDRDPRPRNVVSDAQPSLFASWATGNYRIGLNAGYRYYLQKSQITWQGSIELNRFNYHMAGLGYRFNEGGTYTDNNYANYIANGNYDMSLDLAPRNGNGWSASVGTSHFKYAKELPLSEDAPIDHLTIDSYRGNVAWAKRYGTFTFGASVHGDLEHRQGSESKVQTEMGQFYLIEATYDRLQINTMEVGGEAYFEHRLGGDGWIRQYSLRPMYGLWHSKPDYPEVDIDGGLRRDHRYMEMTNYDMALEASALVHPADRWWVTASLKGGRLMNSRAKIEMGWREKDSFTLGDAHDTAEENFHRMIDPYTHIYASLRADYRLDRNQGLYVVAGYGHRHYNIHGNAWRANVTLGWLF